MASIRAVSQNPLIQGINEQIVYTVTTTPWGSNPSSVSAKVWDMPPAASVATDVTATVMPGAASPTGDVITLPALKSLTVGHVYRVEVRFTVNGNVEECYFDVTAEF